MSSQNEIISKYRSLFQNQNLSKNPFNNQSSINNVLSIEDFLFELIKSSRGASEFKRILVDSVMTELNKATDLSKLVENIILSKYSCDNNILIDQRYTTLSSIGIDIKVNEIDIYGLFKVNPNETPSKYFYEGFDIRKHVNYLLYQSKTATVNSPLTYSYNSKTLFSVYHKDRDTINFKFGSYYNNKPFAEWLKDYIKSLNPLYNQVNFIAVLTDIITGVLSLSSKSDIQIRQNSVLLNVLKNIFGFCDNLNDDNDGQLSSARDFLQKNVPELSGVTLDPFNPFRRNTNANPNSLTVDQLNGIEDDVQNKLNSRLRFVTCNNLELGYNNQELLDLLDSIFNESDDDITDFQTNTSVSPNKNVTNPYSNKSVNTSKYVDGLNNIINNSINNEIVQGEIDLNLDRANIELEFNLGLFKSIPYAFIQSIITPRVTIINKLYSVLSGNTDTKNSNALLDDMGNIIKEMGVSVAQSILRALFKIIREDLLRITEKIVLDILSEQIGDYIAVITSLIDIFNRLRGLFDGDDCDSILNKLLALLKLSGVVPAKPIPPFLITMNAFKPGLSKIKIFNDIKGKLENKGIDTGYVLPDGSPNNMIIAIEETVNSVVDSIKLDSNVQVFVNGAAGPSFGNAQIQ